MELYITVEDRPNGQLNVNFVEPFSSVLTRVKITQEGGSFRYQKEGNQQLKYRGMIDCFVHTDKIAYLGTTGAGIVKVGLQNIGSVNNTETMTVIYRNDGFSAGTLMKFNSLALSEDGKKLVALGHWWGMFAILNTERFCADGNDCVPPVPAGWIVFGVLASLASVLAVIAVIVAIIYFRSRKPTYIGL